MLMIQKVKVHDYHSTNMHMHLLFEVMADIVGDIVVGDMGIFNRGENICALARLYG